MSADICPICSGEIMTYRRFLKEAQPSGISVCQCCGARLRRSRAASVALFAVGILVAVLTGITLNLWIRGQLSAVGAGGTILGLGAGFGVVMTLFGRRLAGWVVASSRSLPSGLATGRK